MLLQRKNTCDTFNNFFAEKTRRVILCSSYNHEFSSFGESQENFVVQHSMLHSQEKMSRMFTNHAKISRWVRPYRGNCSAFGKLQLNDGIVICLIMDSLRLMKMLCKVIRQKSSQKRVL